MKSDDLRLASILTQGTQGDILIVGAPFDFLQKRTIHKGGQDNGPCCLRRFFVKVGPIVNAEHKISIKDVKISDFGNIQYTAQNTNEDPEKCILKITDTIEDILKHQKIPFVFGGSKESLVGSALAFQKVYAGAGHIVIYGKSSTSEIAQNDRIDSNNALSLLIKKYPQSVTFFGTHQKYLNQSIQCQKQQKSKHLTYQVIRNTNIGETSELYTQGGVAFLNLLTTQNKKLHVSLSVQAIQCFRGCRDSSQIGLTPQQILQIFMLLGQNQKVLLLDISDFNPSIQDYQSSLLLVNLLYYFLMGYTKRKSL